MGHSISVEAKIKRFRSTKNESSMLTPNALCTLPKSLIRTLHECAWRRGLLNEAAGQLGRALEDYRRVQDLELRNVEAILRTARIYNGKTCQKEPSSPTKTLDVRRQFP